MIEYILNICILITIYSILALSLNLVVGFTGLLSLAHAAFFGIGAYTTAIASAHHQLPFLTSMILGMFVSFGVATLIGIVLSKFKHDIYALASLGLGVIVYTVFLNWESLTNGALGIPGIPRPKIFSYYFGSNISFLILSLVLFAMVFGLCGYLSRSPFGRVLKGIREKEEVTQIFGYRTFVFKLLVFQISAAMAAVAGSLFATYLSFIDPFSFSLNEGIFITVIIIIGGLASLRGSILGAILIILIPELLRFLGMPPDIAAQMRQFIYGLTLILLMMFRPSGIMGRYKM